MEYKTAIEISKLWKCDRSLVLRYCREGRISGAKKAGNSWLIPSTAEKPHDARRKTKELTSIDLFSGPGGLATGFRWAGIKPLIAVEWITSTALTYCESHGADRLVLAEYPTLLELDNEKDIDLYVSGREELKRLMASSSATILLQGDVSLVTNELVRYILKKRFGKNSVDIVSGGAPCESFSMAGERKEIDYRNELFRNILRIAQAVNSRAFLFENVKGLFSKKYEGKRGLMYQVVCDSFEEESESGVSFRLASRDKETVLLKAADYGVPQMRERLFLVGLNNDDPSLSFDYPTPTHGPNRKQPYITVKDAIMDLPSLELKQENSVYKSKTSPASEGQATFLSFMRGENSMPPSHIPFNDTTLTSHLAPGHTPKMRKRLENILPGESMKTAYERLLTEGKENLAKECFPKKIYGARNRRLRLDEPSFTVTSHCLDEMVHPTQNRGLTPREAARLQSFPDWYIFQGDYVQFHGDPEEDRYEQIGDAIPPLLAKALGESLAAMLEETD